MEIEERMDDAVAWVRHEITRRYTEPRFKFVSAAEFCSWPEPPSFVERENEDAYRRGYWHGALSAITALEGLHGAGFARRREIENILAEWAYGQLQRWRYAPRPKSHETPPELKVEAWRAIRERVFARDGRRCALCSAREDLEIDHIHEVKNGGTPTMDNLRVLCGPCNRDRNRT